MSEYEVFEKLYGISWKIAYKYINPYIRSEYR